MGDVQEFYETRGWRRTGGGEYLDTQLFVDTRPVMQAYRARARARLARWLSARGAYFLDAASGANPAAEYSTGYAYHVCVDFTQQALHEARDRLGVRGLYVRADLAYLPFRSGSFAGVYSGYTLYHIPPGAQERALAELARSLAPGARAVVVYVASWLDRAGHWLRVRGGRQLPLRPDHWVLPWNRLEAVLRAQGLQPQRRVHQLLQRSLTRALVPDNALGAGLLRALAALEGALPGPLARVGYILLVVFRKE